MKNVVPAARQLHAMAIEHAYRIEHTGVQVVLDFVRCWGFSRAQKSLKHSLVLLLRRFSIFRISVTIFSFLESVRCSPSLLLLFALLCALRCVFPITAVKVN